MLDVITQALMDLKWNKTFNNRYGRTTMNNATEDEEEPDRHCFITGLIRDWSRQLHNNFTASLKVSKPSKVKKHQFLMQLASMYIKEYDPNFKYTSIQFSKCMKTPKHKDRNNVGNSMIIAFGDYTGGGLIMYDEDGNEYTHNIYHKPLVFNANENYHRTEDFVGTRFTITFFKIKDFN